MNKKTQERVEKQAVRTVQSVLAGERVGYNNALHWAANWIQSSAVANGHPAVVEFAQNMAMTFKANFRTKVKSESDLAEYHRRVGEIFLAPGQTPYRICKQIWALQAEFSRRIAMGEKSSYDCGDLLASGVFDLAVDDFHC